MRTGIVFAAFVISLTIVGCGDSAEQEASTDHDTTAQAETHAAAPADSAHAHEGEADAAPLLAIMQKLGTEMTALTYGLMTDSAELVSQSAHAVAEHANIADIQQIRNELGSEFAQFERLDIEVHEASVRLAQAAEAGNMNDVLARLTEVQRGCITCHTQFRERVRASRLSSR